MRSRKLYRQLERILETSLSPKDKPLVTGRLLCSPGVALSSLPQITVARKKCLDSLDDDQQDISMSRMTRFQESKQRVVTEIEAQRQCLQAPLTAWQLRQSSYLSPASQLACKNDDSEPISQVIQRLCRACLNIAVRGSKRAAILRIVMLHAQGRHKQAISKLLQWLLGWVKALFSAFSTILLSKTTRI